MIIVDSEIDLSILLPNGYLCNSLTAEQLRAVHTSQLIWFQPQGGSLSYWQILIGLPRASQTTYVKCQIHCCSLAAGWLETVKPDVVSYETAHVRAITAGGAFSYLNDWECCCLCSIEECKCLGQLLKSQATALFQAVIHSIMALARGQRCHSAKYLLLPFIFTVKKHRGLISKHRPSALLAAEAGRSLCVDHSRFLPTTT